MKARKYTGEQVIAVAYPGIGTASVLEKLGIGAYFGYPEG